MLSLSLCCQAQAAFSLEGIQVYQKNARIPSLKKPLTSEDLLQYKNADNLWDVLRSEFSLAHYETAPIVLENISWLMNDQAFLMRTASRSAPYLFFIHQQVKKRKLPIELVLLPIIESGYNPFISSYAGAAGLWQMMPDTATGLGVKQDWWYDGRRDVVTSTRAALDYLTYLFDFFDGNYLLAIAAYNCGQGAVMSAIRHNIRDGKSTDFWSLPLPQQTKTYVPRLLALATIIAHPERYPIRFPAVRNAPYLAQVDVGGQMNLKRAASFAGLHLSKLLQLNPGFTHLVTHPHGPYKLVLPIENVEKFMTQLARTSLSKHIDWAQYKVKPTDTLDILAKRFNTTASSLREINHLQKVALRKGMFIVIPREAATVTPSPGAKKVEVLPVVVATDSAQVVEPEEETLVSSKPYDMQAGDTLYMVRVNDTVKSIADKFRLQAKRVAQVNQIHEEVPLRAGDQLVLPTHLVVAKRGVEMVASSTPAPSPGDTLYMIREGDSMEKIAERFGTTPAAIRVANLMADNKIKEGDHIIIPAVLVKGVG